jgi:hypothetical protein
MEKLPLELLFTVFVSSGLEGPPLSIAYSWIVAPEIGELTPVTFPLVT